MSNEHRHSSIAYFSMEICLHERMPTYSGGLGVLAGDTLRSAADQSVPMVGITLLHRKGYFRQHIDSSGNQTESPVEWKPAALAEHLGIHAEIEIEGRPVRVEVWRYIIEGVSGWQVPVYLLDTSSPQNSEWDRTLTDTLYGGDSRYRLCQEVVLGVGGVAVLEAINKGRYGTLHHINEGHAALLTLRLLERSREERSDWNGAVTEEDITRVRRDVVFTTHTPVPAGHDRFPLDLARGVLGDERMALLEGAMSGEGRPELFELNMTSLALRLSRAANAVSLRHADVSREMFPGASIDAITNGVHAATWVAAPFARLFDQHFPRWRFDNRYLRHAIGIPTEDMLDAHEETKQIMVDEVFRRTRVRFDPGAFTIGFARRATPYKRADLIFSDVARLRAIARRHGPIQLVFAGKAHPHDEPGKDLIRRIFHAVDAGDDSVRVVYVEGYDMHLGKVLTTGVDLWLNNPMRPLEASGTSGMKSALNGVPSLSVLDGWWIEGHIEGVTGWSIGDDAATDADPAADVHELYYKLDKVILPLFHGSQLEWAKVMRNAIALNGSFFNTQRMLLQYMQNAYDIPLTKELEGSFSAPE